MLNFNYSRLLEFHQSDGRWKNSNVLYQLNPNKVLSTLLYSLLHWGGRRQLLNSFVTLNGCCNCSKRPKRYKVCICRRKEFMQHATQSNRQTSSQSLLFSTYETKISSCILPQFFHNTRFVDLLLWYT